MTNPLVPSDDFLKSLEKFQQDLQDAFQPAIDAWEETTQSIRETLQDAPVLNGMMGVYNDLMEQHLALQTVVQDAISKLRLYGTHDLPDDIPLDDIMLDIANSLEEGNQ